MRTVSIRVRLMLYFLALLLLPLITLGILGPIIYSQSIETETSNHTFQLIGQVSRGIESQVRSIEKIIAFLSADPAVRNFFAGRAQSASDSTRLAGILDNLRQSNPEIAGILLVDSQDHPLSQDMRRITRDPLTQEGWYRDAAGHADRVRLYSRPIGRNIRGNDGYSADEIVSIAKAVHHTGTQLVAGVILVDMRVAVIENLFRETSLGNKGFLYVSDSQGGIVYAPLNDVIYRIPVSAVFDTAHPLIMSLPSQENRNLANGDSVVEPMSSPVDYQIVSQQSEYTGWITTAVFSLNESLKEVRFVRAYAIIIALMTMTLAVVAAIFFTSSIARPVITLQRLMKTAEEGDLSVRFDGTKDDEISRLGRSFNAMIMEIQNLIQQVYQDQQLQRESELRILQEQIKPHFLYNTLDTIQWMARDHQANDIVKVVEALTALFRIGLSRGREIIPLSQEFEHVTSYLLIQKARYEDKFDFTIEFDQSLADYQVLKLILQPLVENAIYHGIKERPGHGQVFIRTFLRGAALILQVQDDGTGIPLPRLADLNAKLASGHHENSTEGYGIFNVNERLKLSFGSEFGLSLANGAGAGCIAEIRHPLVEAE